MATLEEGVKTAGDKYRSVLHDDHEALNIQWRHGGPPTYDFVNKLFEEGRTKVCDYIFLSLSHTHTRSRDRSK